MKLILRNNRLFLSAAFFKLLILGLFSSEYVSLLFYPFIKTFIGGESNPWAYYVQHGLNPDAFPYHPLMLFIFSPFVALGGWFQSIYIQTFLFKLPLFFSDIIIFWVLSRFLPSKEKQVCMIYFLNPIVFYSTYIHSQLDIIPTALLMISIYYLHKRNTILSALLIGLALATKMHILIVLPLILIFILKTYPFRTVVTFLAISVSTFLLFELPFIFSVGIQQMTLFNAKQSLLFDSYYSIGKLQIVLPLLSLTVIYFHFFNQRKVNFVLLLFYFGMLFLSTIFFIYPSPAWYIWIVPFIAYYFIQNYGDSRYQLLHFALSATYLMFFIFFYTPDYGAMSFLGKNMDWRIENKNLANFVFTLLEALLIIVMYGFYKFGIKSNSVYSKQQNLAIGIGGDSGSGKTLLMHNLSLILKEKLLQIEGDGEHKWERGDKNWETYTHLDPKANNIHQQAAYLSDLKENKPVSRSEYDHSSGKFTAPIIVKPREFIAISGLHPFYLPKMRKTIDLKIYIDTEERLRQHWKILRDVNKRGYTPEKIIEQIENRAKDATKFIHPQKMFSDIVVRYFGLTDFAAGKKDEQVNLGLRITFDANTHIENILAHLNCAVIWDYHEDLITQYVELHESPNADFRKIAAEHIDNIDEIISTDVEWKSGYDGLIQLIIVLMISDKLKKQ